MAEKILGPHGSKRRKRFLWVPALLIACIALFAVGSAQAVHDLGFQLDGDVSNACPTGSPAPLPLCTSSQKDWADLFTVTDTLTPAPGTEAVTNSSVIDSVNGPFTTATFKRDFETGSSTAVCNASGLNSLSTTFCTGDDTTFATGSKDTLDISGWACNHDNNVNSKIDIMNAYAAQYINPTADANGKHHTILYFGLEKNKDNGTNDVGFWFIQGNANCTAPPNTHPSWTGAHTVGDVLVVSEFTNGGGVSNITAYRWVGGSNPLVQIGTAGDCKTSLGQDAMCATTNSGAKPFNTAIDTPWLTADATLGVGKTGKVVPPDFFEGGIDLTQAFANSGSTAPSCFSTFIGDTRSSNVTGSTLFDYARGTFGQCSSGLTTNAGLSSPTPIQGEVAPPANIGTGVVSSGTDTATVNIQGTPSFNGSLTWYLCGPDAALTTCDHTTGVNVGTTNNVNANGSYVSSTASLTSAGHYCWSAHFEPDTASKNAGVTAADDAGGAAECFTVAAVTPTLSTSASCSATPCTLGSILSDKAFLSGTASQPGSAGPSSTYPTINPTTAGAPAGGSITWVLYAPSNGGCTDTRAASPSSATVSGDKVSPLFYGPSNYTTLSTDPIGTYTFVANYGGNGPNTNAAATNTCASPGTGETVTTAGAVSSASKQRWLPNDRIVLTTNGGTLSGTLTVTLYQGTPGGASLSNCTAGTATSTGQVFTFTPSGDASGTAYQTTNTTYFVGTNPGGTAAGANGTYFWLIHYVASNGLSNPTDRCEKTDITVTD
jgi:hypothetical protein